MDGRNICITPWDRPVIQKIVSESGSSTAISPGENWTIFGGALKGDVTLARVGPVEIEPEEPGKSRITLPFDQTLHAGHHRVQVVHKASMGDPPTLRYTQRSNSVHIKFRPQIVGEILVDSAPDTLFADVTLHLLPRIRLGQNVHLLLNEYTEASPALYQFALPSIEEETDTVTVRVGGVKSADYLVRINVDGAESSLGMINGVYASPQISLSGLEESAS